MTTNVKEVTWNNKTYKIPFSVNLNWDKGQEIEVRNRFGGGSCKLPWFAVAVYDLIMGAERFEDCADVLNHLYPQYDYLFLFDHSSGHDKQREDRLNVKKMTKSFGGSQRKMRNTLIKKEKGYLGPYRRKLNPGDTQSMIFLETDDGPFWMSSEERENTRLDKQIQDKVKVRTLRKDELKKLLEEKGLPVRGTAKDLTNAERLR